VAVEKVDREHQNTIFPKARDQETSKILFNKQSFLCLTCLITVFPITSRPGNIKTQVDGQPFLCLTRLITQSFLKQADQETSRHKLMGSPRVLHA
jgi:hypothetical protein